MAIARALIGHPAILLLDEPFSALDAFTRASLHELLLDLWQELRPTIVMVTHDVDEAVFPADRVVVMRPRPGRVHETMPIGLPRPRRRAVGGIRHHAAQRAACNRPIAGDRTNHGWTGWCGVAVGVRVRPKQVRWLNLDPAAQRTDA